MWKGWIFNMNVTAASEAVIQTRVDAAIIMLFETTNLSEVAANHAAQSVNAALHGELAEMIADGDFSGKVNQIAVLYPRGSIPARRLILVGLGKREDFTIDQLRRAAAQGVQRARTLASKTVAMVTAGTGRAGLAPATAAEALVTGALLGLYQWRGQKTDDPTDSPLEALTLLAYSDDDLSDVQQGVQAGIAVAEGVNFTRDLVNLPPNFCTPEYLAQEATRMAESVGLAVKVIEKQQMQALKMGALLAVAQGSDAPPRFIILEHNPDKAADGQTIVLIGKGVTFDTGGYSLKTRDGMLTMKVDMAGAGAVLGAMRVIARLNLPLHVVGLVPAADNMINGQAYRPSDVITASNGKTIEIISTDAEGRMLLADALVYAKRYNPAAVVDIATLTGSCMVALGTGVAGGLFSIDDTLRDALITAGNMTHERVWSLPLYPDYSKTIESDSADVKNSGGQYGGVGTSAAFLRTFVDYPAWAHIDMAGMARRDSADGGYQQGGATGYGVRLLTEFVRQWRK